MKNVQRIRFEFVWSFKGKNKSVYSITALNKKCLHRLTVVRVATNRATLPTPDK